MGEYRLTYTLAGHIGDANFHIIPLMDLADPAQRAIIPELSKKVFDLVFKYGGSMSGEHNDGLVRTPYLRDMYGLKVYQLFEETKEIFDPQGIFNPGKKVGGSLKESLEHLIKD
jgi:glycolate oxidase